MNRKIRVGLVLLALLSFGLGIGCDKTGNGSQVAQSTSPAPVPNPPVGPVATPAQAVVPPNPEDQMRRVRVDEAMKLAKSGDALIIDVRGTETFFSQHIKGSIDYPLQRIETGDFKGLPRDKLIIAYCA
jgi:hypothetical protein